VSELFMACSDSEFQENLPYGKLSGSTPFAQSE